MFAEKHIAILLVCISISACSEGDNTITVDDLAASIEVGDEVDQSMPYGLALYPAATVTAKLLGGSGLQIKSDASLEELTDFYTAEIRDKGFQIGEKTTDRGKARIVAPSTKEDGSTLLFSISSDQSNEGTYNLSVLMTVDQ